MENLLGNHMTISKTQRRIAPSSVDAFHSLKVRKKKLTQKERVFIACRSLGLANDRMMSEFSGVPRHLLPDRRANLVREGRLKYVENKLDFITNENTDFYEAVE